MASELEADLLLIVSDVNGVYTAPPESVGARLVSDYPVDATTASDSDPSTAAVSSGHEQPAIIYGAQSNVGTGGMQSKVAAAEWTVRQVSFCCCPFTDCY